VKSPMSSVASVKCDFVWNKKLEADRPVQQYLGLHIDVDQHLYTRPLYF